MADGGRPVRVERDAILCHRPQRRRAALADSRAVVLALFERDQPLVLIDRPPPLEEFLVLVLILPGEGLAVKLGLDLGVSRLGSGAEVGQRLILADGAQRLVQPLQRFRESLVLLVILSLQEQFLGLQPVSRLPDAAGDLAGRKAHRDEEGNGDGGSGPRFPRIALDPHRAALRERRPPGLDRLMGEEAPQVVGHGGGAGIAARVLFRHFRQMVSRSRGTRG